MRRGWPHSHFAATRWPMEDRKKWRAEWMNETEGESQWIVFFLFNNASLLNLQCIKFVCTSVCSCNMLSVLNATSFSTRCCCQFHRDQTWLHTSPSSHDLWCLDFCECFSYSHPAHWSCTEKVTVDTSAQSRILSLVWFRQQRHWWQSGKD